MIKIIKLRGKIKLLSGLHIGGGDDTMKIGGIDNQVIKDINSGEPYIPGSSLKGKMRTLLEWNYGLVGYSEGKPFSPKYLKTPFPEEKKEGAINLMKLFGANIIKEDQEVLDDLKIDLGITRINVGDSFLEESKLITSEAKYENIIDRQKGTAQHPRQTERVPAGVEFKYDIRVKILNSENSEIFKKMIKKGLELIENDYLGGNGSRGYGRVEFSNKEKWIE